MDNFVASIDLETLYESGVYNLVGCGAECLSYFVCIIYNWWLGGRARRFIHIGCLSIGHILILEFM